MKKKHTVEDLFEVASGSTPSTSVESYWSSNGSGIKWITPKDLSGLEGSSIFTTERKITLEGLDSCSARLIPKESIILSSRAPIGYVAVMKDEMSCNQGCKALISKKPKEVDPLYFYYLFLTKEKELNNLGSGSTFKELSKTKLEEFSIEVHDIKEQKEIAQVLEQADKARQQRKAANALTDQFLHSSFLSLFGDPVRNEQGYPIVELETVCENIFLGLTSKVDYVESGGFPLIRATDINAGRLSFEKVKFISEEQHKKITKNRITKRGDLLVSKSGSLGTCAIVDTDREFTTYESILTLQLNHEILDNYFLIYLLRDSNFQLHMIGKKVGGTVSHLNLQMFRKIQIVRPPLSLQQQFAGIVAQAEQLRQKQRESERELENLFQGLLQRYFG